MSGVFGPNWIIRRDHAHAVPNCDSKRAGYEASLIRERRLRLWDRFATGALLPVGASAAMAELVDAQR